MIAVLGLLFAGLFAAPLSLEQAKAIALQNNPEYLSAKASFEAAKWGKNSSLGSMLPSLTLDGSYIYMDPATTVQSSSVSYTLNHDFRSVSLNLSQPLYLGGKLWQAYKINGIAENIARLSLRNQELSLYSKVEELYLNALQMQEIVKISELDLQSATRNLEIAQLKYDNGLISNADLLRLQSNKASKEVSGLQARTAMQLSLRSLTNYLNMDEVPTLIELDQSDNSLVQTSLQNFDNAQTDVLIDRAVNYATKHNIGIAINEQSVQISKRTYTMAKSSFLPTIMLIGSRTYSENGIDRYEFEADNQLILSASIPLLPQYKNYAASRQAYYAMRQSELGSVSAKRGIRLGVESAVLGLISNVKQVNAATLALSYSEESYRQLQERFRNNMLSAGDLLDAELMVMSARTSLTNSRYSMLKSQTALMQALGTDDPMMLTTLINGNTGNNE